MTLVTDQITYNGGNTSTAHHDVPELSCVWAFSHIKDGSLNSGSGDKKGNNCLQSCWGKLSATPCPTLVRGPPIGTHSMRPWVTSTHLSSRRFVENPQSTASKALCVSHSEALALGDGLSKHSSDKHNDMQWPQSHRQTWSALVIQGGRKLRQRQAGRFHIGGRR